VLPTHLLYCFNRVLSESIMVISRIPMTMPMIASVIPFCNLYIVYSPSQVSSRSLIILTGFHQGDRALQKCDGTGCKAHKLNRQS